MIKKVEIFQLIPGGARYMTDSRDGRKFDLEDGYEDITDAFQEFLTTNLKLGLKIVEIRPEHYFAIMVLDLASKL